MYIRLRISDKVFTPFPLDSCFRYSFFPNLTLLVDQYQPIYESMGYDRSMIEGYVDQMRSYISTPWFNAGNMKKRSIESTMHEGESNIDTIVKWVPEAPEEYLSSALHLNVKNSPELFPEEGEVAHARRTKRKATSYTFVDHRIMFGPDAPVEYTDNNWCWNYTKSQIGRNP